jgi:hypothetical protein
VNTQSTQILSKKVTMKENSPIAMTLAKLAVWDIALEPRGFLAILRGELTVDWSLRALYVARLLECSACVDAVQVLTPREICALWPEAQHFVRSRSTRLEWGMPAAFCNNVYRVRRSLIVSHISLPEMRVL